MYTQTEMSMLAQRVRWLKISAIAHVVIYFMLLGSYLAYSLYSYSKFYYVSEEYFGFGDHQFEQSGQFIPQLGPLWIIFLGWGIGLMLHLLTIKWLTPRPGANFAQVPTQWPSPHHETSSNRDWPSPTQ